MSDARQDLRDAACFVRWADALPADLRDLMRQAAMSYLEFDDTICITLPYALKPLLRQAEVGRRLVRLVASHYDANRGRWTLNAVGPAKGSVPSDVVMPRVCFQIAPPLHSLH